MGHKGAWLRSRDLLLNFRTPTNVKLKVSDTKQNMKMGQNKSPPRSRDPFLILELSYHISTHIGWHHNLKFSRLNERKVY